MKRFITMMLFALILLLCSRDAITTDPKVNSVPQTKTLSMSHRPDLYAFTQQISDDNTEDADGIVLLRGTLETFGKWTVVFRKLQVLVTLPSPSDSSNSVLGYVLVINHKAIQYLDSRSCDDLKDCRRNTLLSYTFNDFDCLVGKNSTILVEVKAKIRNARNGAPAKGNSLTAKLVRLGVEKTFRDSSGNFITEEGKKLFGPTIFSR